MAVHDRVWESDAEIESRRQPAMKQWRPVGTYTLLGIIFGVWIIQLILQNTDNRAFHNFAFVIYPDWYVRPWSPITSTFAHATYGYTLSGNRVLTWDHIFFNSLMLFFFGPILERIMGLKKYLIAFVAAGAIAGILQATLNHLFTDQYTGALGASGALMMVFGALVILMPKEKILIWGILPLPFWAAGVGYALLDILGVFNPNDGIGNFAHLSGMALGIWLGIRIKQDLAKKGLMLR